MEGSDSDEFDFKIGAVFSLATSISKENCSGTNDPDGALGTADIAEDHDGGGEHDTGNFVYETESCDSKSQLCSIKDITKSLVQSMESKGPDSEHNNGYDLTKVKTEPVSADEESISVCEPCIPKDPSQSQFQTETNSGEPVSSSDISNDATVERRTCRKRKPNMLFSDNFVLDYKTNNSLRDVSITLNEVKLAQRNQLPFKESTTAQSNVVTMETSVSASEKTKTCSQPKVKKKMTSNKSCVSQTVVPSKSKHKNTKRQSKYEFERLDDLGNSHAISSPKRLLSNRVQDLMKSVRKKKRKMYSDIKEEGNSDLLSSKQGTRGVQVGRTSKHGDSASTVIKTEPISVDRCGQNTSDMFESSASELSIPYRVPLSKNEDSKGGDRYSTQYDTNWLIKRNGEMILASMETVNEKRDAISSKDGLLPAAKLPTSASPSLKVPGSGSLTMKTPISLIKRIPVSNSTTLSVPSSTVTRTATSSSLATKVPILNSLFTKEPVSSTAVSNTRKTTVKRLVVSDTSSKTQGQISTARPLDKENSNKAVEYVKTDNRNYTHTVKELAKAQNTKKFFQLVIGNKVVLIPSDGDAIIPKAYVVDVNKTKPADNSTDSQIQNPSLKIVPDNDIDAPPILSPQGPLVLDFKEEPANSKPPVLHPESPVSPSISPTKTSKPAQKSPIKARVSLKSLLPNIITKSVKANHAGATSGDSAKTDLIEGVVKKSKTTGTVSPPMIKKNSKDPAVGNSDFTQQVKEEVVDNTSPELANSEDVSERIRKLREKLKAQQKDVEQARINIKTFKSVEVDDIT